MNFKEEQQKKVQNIEEILKEYLPKPEGYQKEIMEAMEYSVMAGGKRLRPMLMRETFRLFGGEGRVVEPFMAAVEMIHTYSLVHDDLPAMDNDEYRRGRKTTHVVYGEAMGILAGDALLNYAFETAVKAFEIEPKEGQRISAALKILAQKAGIFGMIGGQVVDVASCGTGLDQKMLDFIYELKTGALIECAMMVGAVLAGAREEDVRKVEKIASDVGIAFQIQDDILDVTSTTEELGKPVHSDEKNEKTTYVTLKGLEEAAKDVEKLSKEALMLLMDLPGENPFLTELIRELIHRRK
ncbi:polyprenyl synthetase family protein [Roseburia hominis]